MRPAKIQISLRIRAGWSESSLGAFLLAMDAKFPYADNEDWSDCANAQADLSLRWVHMWEGTFSHVAAHIILKMSRMVIGIWNEETEIWDKVMAYFICWISY